MADAGGVTRAASFLNLTQSAVSMQIKRLEESLDLTLLDRQGRGVALTSAGEQLLTYARRIVDLNDEVYGKLTNTVWEGEIRLFRDLCGWTGFRLCAAPTRCCGVG